MEMRASSEVGFSALCRHSFVRMSDKVRHLGCSLKTPPLGPSAPLRKGFFFFMAQPPLLFRGCCKTLKGRGRNHKKHKKHKTSCAFLCILCFLWFLPRFSFGFCNTLIPGGESVIAIPPPSIIRARSPAASWHAVLLESGCFWPGPYPRATFQRTPACSSRRCREFPVAGSEERPGQSSHPPPLAACIGFGYSPRLPRTAD